MKLAGVTALLLLAAAMAVPSTTAQAQNGQGVSLTATNLAAPVPYEGSGAIPVTVTVGCIDAQQDSSVTVGVSGTAPSWLNVTPATITASPGASCVTGGGNVVANGTVGIKVSKDAPGVVPHKLTLVATVNNKNSPAQNATFSVAYHSNYTLVPQVSFPLNVTKKVTTFNVTATQASNAKSMIMVDGTMTATNGALVSGIAAQQYNNSAGNPDTKTYTVTFTAPEGKWTNSTIKFTTFGHYNFEGFMGGPAVDHKNFTWQVLNGGSSGGDDDGNGTGGGKKDKLLPAPAGPLTAILLVAIAAITRRR